MSRVDRLAMAALYQRHLKDVLHYVLRRVPRIEAGEARLGTAKVYRRPSAGGRAPGEDITAEVFAAAAAGLPRFRGHCPPSVWLLSIARRQIALARRRAAGTRERSEWV